jgi:L-asparaginase
MKKILIIFTGGTIGMKKDPDTNTQKPSLSGEEILNLTPGIDKIAKIEYYDFGMFPGPHMKPEKMFSLSNLINDKIKSYDGIIVTHGTDTIEETAFLTALTYNGDRPIIFIGAMRSSSDLGWDGPGNLIDAVYAASSNDSLNHGVMVVMNAEIHSASQVTKTNTHTLNAFASADFGPIGFIDNNKAYFYQAYTKRQFIKTNKIERNVDLIKCTAGMDDSIIKFCVKNGTKGIVIEGMGRGNVPPEMINGVKYALKRNIPVILTSRCLMGKVLDSYGYPGAGKELTKMGVIMADNLPGQKARIKLIVALGSTNNHIKIKDIFEKGYY